MYSASADFLNAIESDVRKFHWSGSISTATPIEFDDEDNLLSGTIKRIIAEKKLNIGTVYISQISLEAVLPTVSRYELYEKQITLNVSIDGASDVVPMGIFTIAEATQTADKIKIKGYDNMAKFDVVDFHPSSYTSVLKPYNWLTTMCTACGITLGNTQAQIEALPNGRRKTGFADSVADVKTWRDVLSYLASYLGCYAYIGRDGKLYLSKYSSTPNDTIHANFRYTSNLSDFRTTYDGLYAVYKDGGVQEYVSNENSNGIILDLGTNPFLQFSNENNRLNALQEIIDAWNGIYYVPYNSNMPLVPTYDVGDILKFVDNQSAEYDIGVITEIVYNVNGDMSVKCCGDNPKLMSAQDRFTKTVGGLSKDYSNGQEVGNKEFWLLFNHNTEEMTVDSTETLVTEIEFEQKTFAQNIEMILTLDGVVSTSSEVNVRVVVDDDIDLQMSITESRTMKGEREFHCSNPQKIYGEGTHACKVYMTVTDSPILWSDFE